MSSACRLGLQEHSPLWNEGGSELAQALRFDHVGLGLNRYLHHHATAPEKTAGVRPEIALLEAAQSSASGDAYSHAFQRWEENCKKSKRFFLTAETAGPLAIGLGNESPLEVGITVHHTYGVPVIPGSAVKGLCRRAAKSQNLSDEQMSVLLGSQKAAGCIVYHDAWFDPGTAQSKPFHRDVITVHHQDYYGKRGAVWPTDFDDPNPVAFLVVRPDARFLFSFDCPEAWQPFVGELLKHGLETMGLGGKTNAGYGRFDKVVIPDPPAPPWINALVIRNAGTGELTATLGGQTARATGKQAVDLMAGLNPEMERALRGGPRRANANVRVAPRGNGWQIVEILAPEGLKS